MGMYGNLIGSAVGGTFSLGSGIIGAILGNKGYSRALDIANDRLDEIKQRKIENRAHRDKLYYENALDNAENQAAITQMKEALTEGNQRANDTNIISGGTDESLALQKQAGTAAAGNMMTQMAVNGAQKKEAIWNNAEAQENALNNEQDQWARYKADTQKARYLSQAQNVVNTGNAHAASHVEFGKSLPW